MAGARHIQTPRRTLAGLPLHVILAACFGAIVVLSCTSVGVLTYVLRSERLTQRMRDHLAFVRDDKISDIAVWFESRRNNLALWSTAPEIVAACQVPTSRAADSQSDLVHLLERMRSTYRCYSVGLFDPAGGNSIITTHDSHAAAHRLPREYRDRVLAGGGIVASDVFVCPADDEPTMILAGPVRGTPDGRIVGILALFIDVPNSLYRPLLQSGPLGRTGETVLVNQSGELQAPLHPADGAIGRTVMPGGPVRLAALGQTGVVTAPDDRGTPAMAAYGFIPGVNWGIVVKQDMAEITAPVRQMAWTVFSITLIAVVLALGASYLVARRIAAPAVDIARVTHQILAGNTAVRAEEQGPQEIQTIARDFNAMMEQLCLHDQLKSQFLSNVSHELRTPLNSIMALSQLMLVRGTGLEPAQDMEYLRTIDRNGRHLLNLINDILDLSRIEAGRIEVNRRPLNPAEVVEQAVEVARPLAEGKGLTLTTQIESAPTVHTDHDRLYQILVNLLSNAVKFTDRGGIDVRLAVRGNRVHFEVRDTGIGIAQANQFIIFDEFRQVDGSSTRRHDGTGLGLSIARKLARLLGGDITVQSQPGDGSTFTLTLPIA